MWTIGSAKFDGTSDRLDQHPLGLPASFGKVFVGYGSSAGGTLAVNFAPATVRNVKSLKVTRSEGGTLLITYLAKAKDGAVYEIRREGADGGLSNNTPVLVEFPATVGVGAGWPSLGGYNSNFSGAEIDQTANLSATSLVVATNATSPGGVAGTYHRRWTRQTQTRTRYYKPGVGLVEETWTGICSRRLPIGHSFH